MEMAKERWSQPVISSRQEDWDTQCGEPWHMASITAPWIDDQARCLEAVPQGLVSWQSGCLCEAAPPGPPQPRQTSLLLATASAPVDSHMVECLDSRGIQAQQHLDVSQRCVLKNIMPFFIAEKAT
jgi:hypothetical protein